MCVCVRVAPRVFMGVVELVEGGAHKTKQRRRDDVTLIKSCVACLYTSVRVFVFVCPFVFLLCAPALKFEAARKSNLLQLASLLHVNCFSVCGASDYFTP